ncbi:MAG TPA: N,N-dimethylformamidase beta subunit family domain-containing protein, partial [Anaeromyxobacteraceae bacterium]|nr:N,N-dimethylformamidase beta subunit family domain-containing protein [Anaeromyxobacteraceae bacterium]
RNPIPAENARAGEFGWNGGRAATSREVELYASRVSVRAGEALDVMASVSTPQTASWALYRLGWYGGAGARRVDQGGPVALSTQPACPLQPVTALVRCAWSASFRITLAPDALSGLYAVRVTRADGFFAMAPLVVVDDRPADLLLQASVTTWQAYNPWAGESLYADASGTMPTGKAVQVSFDRPYADATGLGIMAWHDLHLAPFIERHGWDVTYTTNARVAARGPAELLRAGAFVSSVHDEYWPGEERDAVDAALAAGQPMIFFGANPAYWKVRLEALDGPENPRIVTCWKGRTQDDPIQGPGVTARYRDPPIDRPENGLAGVMYQGWTDLAQPLVVADASSWLFEGTGLANGDALPWLVGYEFDRSFDNGFSPPGLRILARSPVVDGEGKASWHETATWTAPSGALVFATGTMDWANALVPGERADPRVEVMTANVFRRALGLPVPPTVGATPPLALAPPHGPFAAAVSTVATGLDRPTALAWMPDGALAVVESGRNRVLRVTPAGDVTVLAGSGATDPPLDGVPGAQANFSQPAGILALPDGSLLLADSDHNVLRRIGADPQRTVTRVAGRPGPAAFADGIGAGARFAFPIGMVRDPVSGKILVADSGNSMVRVLDLATGAVTTLAGGSGALDADGPAASARLLNPTALAAAPAPDDRVFVVVSGSRRLKAILPDAARTVLTLAGSDEGFADGTGTEARVAPQAGATYAAGEVWFSDPSSLRVRALAPGATAASSVVHTVAGSGRSAADDGPGAAAAFRLPLGLAVAPDGTVYVADAGAGAIRAIRR